MKVVLPAPVGQFEDCVPHRPPMVWIDEVISANPSGGECLIRVRRDALYCVDGRIEPMSCIEWIAQAFAYIRAVWLIEKGLRDTHKATDAFLVGIKNADLLIEADDEELQSSHELRVVISGFREFGPIIMLDGEVRLPSGRSVMQSSLRVYHGVAGGASAKH